MYVLKRFAFGVVERPPVAVAHRDRASDRFAEFDENNLLGYPRDLFFNALAYVDLHHL